LAAGQPIAGRSQSRLANILPFCQIERGVECGLSRGAARELAAQGAQGSIADILSFGEIHRHIESGLGYLAARQGATRRSQHGLSNRPACCERIRRP
jgi:hypothetical protein